MENIFFNNDGELNINKYIYNHPSYKKILEDGVVSKEELQDQYDLVFKLFDKIEEMCDEAQKELIKDVIVEMNVLNSVSKIHSLQTIDE